MNKLYKNTPEERAGSKDELLRKLQGQGMKITKQRALVIDIILEEEIGSCKDIHQKASQVDPKIGVATVYRMVKNLEKIGAVNRKISVII